MILAHAPRRGAGLLFSIEASRGPRSAEVTPLPATDHQGEGLGAGAVRAPAALTGQPH